MELKIKVLLRRVTSSEDTANFIFNKSKQTSLL